MIIVITTKIPRADWNNLNVKRFPDVEFYSGTNQNQTGISIIARGRTIVQINGDEIANVVITYD